MCAVCAVTYPLTYHAVPLPLTPLIPTAVHHADYQSVRRILLTSTDLRFLDLSEASLELRVPSSSSAAYTDSDLLAQACAGTYALPGSNSSSRSSSRRASSSDGDGGPGGSRVDGGVAVASSAAWAAGVEGVPQRAMLAMSVKGVREVRRWGVCWGLAPARQQHDSMFNLLQGVAVWE